MFGESKRTFRELQTIILKTLKKGKATAYDISKETGLHYNVVSHQLILLKGHDFASLDFEHKRFRLYSITDKGLKYLRKITR